MKKIPYNKQYIDFNDLKSIIKATKQEFITTGKSVTMFENSVSNFLKSKYVLSCSSGTAAIHLALKAISLKKGDVVLMPSVNFIAAYSMCSLSGAKIFLTDVDPFTGQMRPKDLLDCINKNKIKKIKAVFVMYLGGYPENIIEFNKIRKIKNFYLIEDACHAFGASYKYNNHYHLVGSAKHCDISLFSLHPVKTFTTGEGGLISTNNKNFRDKIENYRSHGILRNKDFYWKYDIKQLGFNYRLSDINCALGLSQLKKVKKFLNKRKKIYDYYIEKLDKLDRYINFNKYSCLTNPSYHLFLININYSKFKISKDDLLKHLKKNNIFAQYHYIPIYKFSFYKTKSRIKYEGAKLFYKNSISLPIYYQLKFKEVENIVKIIGNFLKKNITSK